MKENASAEVFNCCKTYDEGLKYNVPPPSQKKLQNRQRKTVLVVLLSDVYTQYSAGLSVFFFVVRRDSNLCLHCDEIQISSSETNGHSHQNYLLS